MRILLSLFFLTLLCQCSQPQADADSKRIMKIIQSINYAAKKTEKDNKATVKVISLDRHCPGSMETAKKPVLEVHQSTNGVLEAIRNTKQALIYEIGGGIDTLTGNFKHTGNKKAVTKYMLGDMDRRGRIGKAYYLDSMVRKYVEGLNILSGERYPYNKSFWYDNNINVNVKANDDFVNTAFNDCTLEAALAKVLQLEWKIIKHEQHFLQVLTNKFSTSCLYFDRIYVKIAPYANTVAEGETYRADMFLTNFIPINVTMAVDRKRIPVSNGKGVVAFTATGGTPDGTLKEWQGSITFPTVDGRDTTIAINRSYRVYSKPVN